MALRAALCGALAAGCSAEGSAPGRATSEPPRPSASVVAEREASAAEPPPAASAVARPPASVEPTATATPERPPSAMVELAPTQGDLLPLLRAEAGRAKKRGLAPFVEFYADWCAPCKVLAKSMSDARVADAFRGTYVIKLNLDDWQDKLAGTGFDPRVIPAFYALDEEGRPTGRKIDEKAWKKTTPATIAGPLAAFFRGAP